MKNTLPPLRAAGFAILGLVAVAPPASAEDTGDNWHVSGFMSVVAGAALSGSYNDPLSYSPQIDCPCVMTDWSNGGVYEGSNWTFQPDTKAGIQFSYDFTDHISFTSQIVRRATDNSSDWDKDLQWAYITYRLSDSWSLDAGRKRIPLYFYSEFQDVGFAYTMITPPSAMYGWEVNNYEGVSLNHAMNWSGINMQASLFGGGSTVKENHYTELYYPTTTNTQWSNIVGATLEMSKDWWVARVNYVQADVQFFSQPTSMFVAFGPQDRQQTFLVRVEPGDFDLGRLSRLHGLMGDLLAGRTPLPAATARVQAIMSAPAAFPEWLTLLAFSLASASVARFLGGAGREILASALLGLITGGLAVWSTRGADAARVFPPLAAFAASV